MLMRIFFKASSHRPLVLLVSTRGRPHACLEAFGVAASPSQEVCFREEGKRLRLESECSVFEANLIYLLPCNFHLLCEVATDST